MALPKLFQRIFWHNNTTPAINEDNLNAMSKAIDDIDNRVIVLGDDVITVIPQIQAYLAQAEDLVEAMELLSQNPPYIGQNGNWWVWDTNTSAFVDSGVDASITVDIADITMLAPGATPYVTNSGTATDPVFHLFIPRGATGNGISTIAKTGTSGLVDTYTITMTDGTTSTFTVTNGSGDMNKSVYDPTNAIANAGGMKSAATKNSTNAVTANSTDLVESGAVYTSEQNIYEVMGQNGAKNHIFVNLEDAKEVNTTAQPNKGSWSGDKWTYVGLSHTVNDGEITISGTQTGAPVSFYFSDSSTWGLVNGETYIISFNPSGTLNSNHYYERLRLTKDDTQIAEVDVADETVTFTYDSSSVYKLGIINRQANVSHNYTIKPMICPKSMYDFDPTYQSYAETNQQLTDNKVPWDDYSEVGAVNHLDSDISTTVDSSSGLTFTVNPDKSVIVSVTSGSYPFTVTANASLLLKSKPEFSDKLPLKLSGCPSGGDFSTGYRLQYANYSNMNDIVVDTGDGGIIAKQFDYTTYPYARISIEVRKDYVMTGPLTFKPMLTEPSYNGPYVPYAKTNRELTEDVADISFLNTTNKTTAGYLSGTSAAISDSLAAIGLNTNIALWTWLQGLSAYYSNPYGIQICVAGNQMNISGTTTQMWKDVLNIFGLSSLLDPWLEINITNYDAGRGYLKVTTNDCVTKILYFSNWAKSGNVYTISMT